MSFKIIFQYVGKIILKNNLDFFKSNNLSKVTNIQNKSIQLSLLLSIPASLGLIIASEEIVNGLFGYGTFTQNDVKLTSDALKYFGFGLIAFSLVKVLSNPSTEFVMHYARQDLMWLKYHLKVEPKSTSSGKYNNNYKSNYIDT